jgi:hypothetical protein
MLSELTPAQRALADYMSELSEQAFHAGWMQDLEHALWRAVLEGPFRYGHLELAAVHVERLRELREACEGWIRFDETKEESFVPSAEWKNRLYDRARAL